MVNRRFCCLQYDCSLTPTKNIGLPDSLLSKFDLLFIVLDEMDADINCQISEHVLCMHCYHTPGEDAGMLVSSFLTIQKSTIMSSRWLHSQWVLLWEILCHWEEACNFHYQTGLLVSFQCYGTFDATKWFRIVKKLNSFSICRDAKNGGWGYSRWRGRNDANSYLCQLQPSVARGEVNMV